MVTLFYMVHLNSLLPMHAQPGQASSGRKRLNSFQLESVDHSSSRAGGR